MRRSHFTRLLYAVGILLLLFFYIDPYISQFCSGLPHSYRHYLKAVSYVLSPPLHLLGWSIIYLFTKYKCKGSALFFLSRKIFYSLLLSLSLVYCMKILLGRARPELLVKDIYGFYFMTQNHHYHSFPSGHASVAACLFFPLLSNFPKYRLYWILLPIILSSSRVLLNYHFVSDIVGGGMICYMVQNLYRKYGDKKRKSDLLNPIS